MWTFKNEGTTEWPADTKLMYTNGSKLGFIEHPIGKLVRPGETADFTLTFTAVEAGEYTSFFKLAYGGGRKQFGAKVYF